MKFNTVIIGGGLSGLVCGIRLQKAGIKTAIISTGQSAMHFSSGSFDLLGKLPTGEAVTEPLEAIKKLGAEHPYSKVGAEKVAEYAAATKDFFASCSIKLNGDAKKNGYRITPTGDYLPTWLSFEEFPVLESKDEKLGEKALIINLFGYLDFNTKFIASSLEKNGTKCRVANIKYQAAEAMRENPTEARSTNIAKTLVCPSNWETFKEGVKKQYKGEDLVIIPAVFGLKNAGLIEEIRAEFKDAKVLCFPTMPPSVPGIRTQATLKEEYLKLGGEFLLGDTVCAGDIKDSKVVSLSTVNFEEIKVMTDNVVLASGSFFSKGLIADPYKVYEPVFGLDVDFSENRGEWYNLNFFKKQNYVNFGVKTNEKFQTSIQGKTIENLYAIGSVLSGANTLYEGCGSGVAIMTAMKVADEIISK